MASSFPILTTQRLRLRQFEAADVDNVYRGLSDPEVIRYYGVSFDSLVATQEQMCWFRDLEKSETGIWWAICSLDNRTFYGAGGYNGLNREHQKAEIGFWLSRKYWGQGFMQETFPLICDYGFHSLGLNRIEGFVNSANQNCKRAIEKLGFKLEGTMRNVKLKKGNI